MAGTTRLVDGEKCRIDAGHLAGADADRCAVLGQHDGIGFHARHRTPREQQVHVLGSRRLAFRHNLPVRVIESRAGALLHQDPAAHRFHIKRSGTRWRRSLEHAKIFLFPEHAQRFRREGRCKNALHEELGDGGSGGFVHRHRERNDRPERAHWIAGQRLFVRVERGGAGGESAGRRVFHYSARRFTAERIGGEQRPFEIEKIVERQFFPAALHESGQPGTTLGDVECRTLTGILSIPERLLPFQCDRQARREMVATL